LGFFFAASYHQQNQFKSEELMLQISSQFKTLPALAVSVFFFSSALFGSTITNVSYSNTSRPNSTEVTASTRQEFRSAGSVSGVSTAANVASLTATTQWVGALQVTTAGPANLLFIYPSFELSFTIDDPSNSGYTLDLSSVTRGYLSASFVSGSNLPLAIMASGTSFGVEVDSGSGYVASSALAIFGSLISANQVNPSTNELVLSTRNANIGNFVGTRDFRVKVSYEPSPAGTIVFQNNEAGEAAIRYGLDTTLQGFTLSTYPGPDNEAASTHGNFFTVSATFNESTNSTAVPEPATSVLFGTALVAGAIASRRRRG
jgi:hypothetical protein